MKNKSNLLSTRIPSSTWIHFGVSPTIYSDFGTISLVGNEKLVT